MESQTRLTRITEKLRAQGCRMTPQRLALLKILCTSQEHLSAAQLYAQIKTQFPTTSLATVYKTLAVLKDVDEVLEISFGGDTETHYDGYNPKPHPHLICVQCGKILDADVHTPQALAQFDLARSLAECAGYQVTGYRFDVYGLCPACRQAE